MQGRGYELNAIAAAVVGGCSLQGGVGLIPGTMLGVLFLRVVIDAVAKIVKVGADDYEGMIVGLLVVLAVAFNELRQARRGGGKQFFPGLLGATAIGILAILAGVLSHDHGRARRGHDDLRLVVGGPGPGRHRSSAVPRRAAVRPTNRTVHERRTA